MRVSAVGVIATVCRGCHKFLAWFMQIIAGVYGQVKMTAIYAYIGVSALSMNIISSGGNVLLLISCIFTATGSVAWYIWVGFNCGESSPEMESFSPQSMLVILNTTRVEASTRIRSFNARPWIGRSSISGMKLSSLSASSDPNDLLACILATCTVALIVFAEWYLANLRTSSMTRVLIEMAHADEKMERIDRNIVTLDRMKHSIEMIYAKMQAESVHRPAPGFSTSTTTARPYQPETAYKSSENGPMREPENAVWQSMWYKDQENQAKTARLRAALASIRTQPDETHPSAGSTTDSHAKPAILFEHVLKTIENQASHVKPAPFQPSSSASSLTTPRSGISGSTGTNSAKNAEAISFQQRASIDSQTESQLLELLYHGIEQNYRRVHVNGRGWVGTRRLAAELGVPADKVLLGRGR